MFTPSTTLDNTSTTETTHARTLRSISLILIPILFITAVFYGYVAYSTQAWQMAAASVFTGLFLPLIWLVLLLIRRGKTYLAAQLLTYYVVVVIVLVNLVMAGFGLILGVLMFVLTAALASATLPSKETQRALIVAGISAFVVYALDLFLPAYRFLPPAAVKTFLPIASAVGAVIFGFFSLRQYNDYSLRTKLIVAFLAVSLTALIGLSYFLIVNQRQTLTAQADNALLGASHEVAKEVDTFLQTRLDIVQNQANLPDLATFLETPPNQRDTAAKGSTAEVTAILHSFIGEEHYITSIGLLDLQGKDIVDTNQADVGTSKANRDYFQQVLQTQKGYVSQAEYYTGEYSIFFAAPVFNESGQLVGVLRTRHNFAHIQELLAASNDLVGVGSYPVLFDETLLRLGQGNSTAPVGKTFVTLDPQTFSAMQAAGRIPANVTAQEISTNQDDFKAGLETGPVFPAYSVSIKGTVIYAVAKSTVQPSWTITYAQPEKTLYAPVEATAITTQIAVLVLMFLIIFAAVFIAQTISRPVLQLTAAAQDIAEGKQGVQAQVTSKDEIGELAKAFNTMTAQLTRRGTELATVAEVGTAASTILETDKLLQQVVDLAKERFHLYHTHIYLLDETGENLVLASGAGEPGRKMVAEGRSIPLDREQSLVARAAREKKGVTVNDVTIEPGFLSNPLLPDTRSELAVPMIVGENLIGVLDVQSEEVGRFTESDINIQTTLAAQVAVALNNVHQYEEAQRTATQLSEALNIAKLANWEYDVARDRFIFNDHFYSIFHTTAEQEGGYELSSADYAERLVHPDDLPLVGTEIEKALTSTDRHYNAQLEHRVRYRDGGTGYVSVNIHIERDDQGNILRYYGANQDITERKILQEQLAQRARQQEAINTITQRIQAASTIEEAMKVAARELGQALGQRQTLVALEPSILGDNGKSTVKE